MSGKKTERQQERQRDQKWLWRQLNRATVRKQETEWDRNNSGKRNKYVAKRQYKSKYNITITEYYELLELQNYQCAICKRESWEGEKGLSVDHDHITGKVRGLLCTGCNLGIG